MPSHPASELTPDGRDASIPVASGRSATTESPLISVIILTRNRNREVMRAVASALAQSYNPFEVIVLDNASDRSPEPDLLERFGGDPRLRFLRSGRNLGAAGGRNHAVAAARGGYLLYLDDDARILDQYTLQYVARFFDRFPDAGALQFSAVAPDGEELYPDHGPRFDPDHPELTLMNYLLTCGCAVPRSAHDATGGFPEEMGVYYEDNHYAFALLRAGLAIYHTDAIRVEHPRDDARSGPRHRRFHFLKARNVTWLFLSFFPIGEALRFILRFQAGHLIEALRAGNAIAWLLGALAALPGVPRSIRRRPKLTPEQIARVHLLDRHRELLPDLAPPAHERRETGRNHLERPLRSG